MKNTIPILLAAALLLAGLTSNAQTNTLTVTNPPALPPAVQSFATSVQQYFTDLNTNYTWTNVTVEVDTGYKQVTGANAASELYAQYDIKSFDIIAGMQFSGVGSAINGVEIGGGYALISKYDTKLEAQLLFGYDNNRAAAEIEPRLALKKKLSLNTYAVTAVSLPMFSKGQFNSAPSVYIGAGATF
jgi:hypothetical protein